MGADGQVAVLQLHRDILLLETGHIDIDGVALVGLAHVGVHHIAYDLSGAVGLLDARIFLEKIVQYRFILIGEFGIQVYGEHVQVRAMLFHIRVKTFFAVQLLV